jgi:hypothetical protein
MAELQGHLLKYKGNAKQALENVENFMANLKPHRHRNPNMNTHSEMDNKGELSD